MNILRKIIVILAVFCIMCILMTNISQAGTNINLDTVTDEANDFLTRGQELADSINTGEMISNIIPIAQALRVIGIGVLLCVGAFMGIKWVTAKPDEQAKLKQQSIGLLVAAVVIIGATTIWSIVVRIIAQL